MFLTDRAEVTGRRVLDGGFLEVRATFARTGIQTYRGSELGFTDERAAKLFKIYRSPEEVFAPDSMVTFANAPFTDDHPPEMVTSKNWRKYARGISGPEVTRNGDTMDGVIIVQDADTIAKIDGGKVELSNGYVCDLDWTGGVDPATGEAYDAAQTNIRGNHIALVGAGRCGAACRLSDSPCGCGGTEGEEDKVSCNCHGGKPEMADQKPLTTVTHDGLTIEVTDHGAQVIRKLQGQLADTSSKLEAATTAATTADAQHTAAIAAKDEEITALKAQILTPDAMDAAIVARNALIGDAKRLLPSLDPKGLSDHAIRAAAVAAKVPADKLAGKDAVKDAGWYQATFDALLISAPAARKNDAMPGGGYDPVRRALQTAQPQTDADPRIAARAERDAALTDAWKGETV